MFQKENLMKLNESETSESIATYKKTRRTSLPKLQFEESKEHENDLTSNMQYDY